MTNPTICPTCTGGVALVAAGDTLKCPSCNVRYARPAEMDAPTQHDPSTDRGTDANTDPEDTAEDEPEHTLDATIDSLPAASMGSGPAPAISSPASTAEGRTLPFTAEFFQIYEPVSFLGKGAMGAVFLMKQVKLSRLVAVKVVNEEAVTPDVAARLIKEAQTLASLNHPNILAIYDVGQDGNTPYMVSEYVEGEPLNERLKREPPLSMQQCLRIVSNVLDGLRAAHKQGIIHRDLKPSNIFLASNGKPKIGDFGLAKSQNAPSGTAVGRLLGTPAYMSPEQCRGRAVSPQSDIYAMGVMLYELLTGERPFTGPLLIDYLRQHTMEPAPRARAMNPDIPPALDSAIAKAMEKDPAMRFRNPGDFRKVLLEVSKSLSNKPAYEPVRMADGSVSQLGSELRAGMVLANRYQLVRILGAGGMGQVWLAKDEIRAGIEVAIKLLPPELWRDTEARANLVQEANIALKLTHKDIVRLINIEPGDSPFLVMEAVVGPTLAEEMFRRRQEILGPLSPKECLEVLEPVAQALDYAHGVNVIHRDVKPSNILLLTDGNKVTTAKLADFGIAAEVAGLRQRMTGAAPLGTLAYMSPEQVRSEKLDGRADIYSLGATLYQMLSGNPPFGGPDIINRIKNEPPPEVEGISPNVAHVLRRCLAKDRKDRPATAMEFVNELRAALFDGSEIASTFRAHPKEHEDTEDSPVDAPTDRVTQSDYPTVRQPGAPEPAGPPTPTPGGAAAAAAPPAPPVPVPSSPTGVIALLASLTLFVVAGVFVYPRWQELTNPNVQPTIAAPTGSPTAGAPASTAVVQPSIAAAKGRLLIEGVDAGRPVESEDGTALGNTPGPIELAPGEHRLVVKPGPNFEDDRRTIRVTSGQEARWKVFRQARIVKLHVVTQPEGAEISVNDEPRGKAPLDVEVLAGREAKITATLAGHENEIERVQVNAGEVNKLRMKLKPAEVAVTVQSTPAGAKVFNEAGLELGVTPWSTKVPPGTAVRYSLALADHKPASVAGKTELGKPLTLAQTLEHVAPATPASVAPVKQGRVLTQREQTEYDRLLGEVRNNLRGGEYAKALEAARNALEIDPDRSQIHQYIAACYVAQKQLGKAVKALERAVELDPADNDVRNTLANVLLQLDQADRALVIAKKIIETQVNDATYWDTYGQALLALKKKPEAADAFKKALRLDPDYKKAQEGLAKAQK